MTLVSEEIIIKQGKKIKELEHKIFQIQITGEIPKLNHNTRKRKIFKNFVKDNVDINKYIDKKIINKVKNMEHKMSKMNKIIEANNLKLNGVSIHKTEKDYIRIAMFLNVQELLDGITNCKEKFYKLPNGYKVKPQSLRYQTFVNNLTCVSCGLKGCFLALEKSLTDFGGNEKLEEGRGFHLNLYALNSDGKEILMTKDHIFPRSKGGSDELSNLQTMCVRCNEKKSDKIIDNNWGFDLEYTAEMKNDFRKMTKEREEQILEYENNIKIQNEIMGDIYE